MQFSMPPTHFKSLVIDFLILNEILWFWTKYFNCVVVPKCLQRLHCQLAVVMTERQSQILTWLPASRLIANTVHNWKGSVPCSSSVPFFMSSYPVHLVLRIEHFPLTLVTTQSHANLLSINHVVLKVNGEQELKACPWWFFEAHADCQPLRSL